MTFQTPYTRAGAEAQNDLAQLGNAVSALERIASRMASGLKENQTQPAVSGAIYTEVIGADFASKVTAVLAILTPPEPATPAAPVAQSIVAAVAAKPSPVATPAK